MNRFDSSSPNGCTSLARAEPRGKQSLHTRDGWIGSARLACRSALVATLVYSCCACSETRRVAARPGALCGPEFGRQVPAQGAKPVAIHLVPMSEEILRDKIHGAWLGQMIGVTWGFPTEFYARYIWHLFPEIHQVKGVPRNI